MAASSNSRIFLLFFLATLAAFGPFVTDFYLPTLPEQTTDFHTSPAMVQLGLSNIMWGLAAGQLLVGPISDRRGRKKPLFWCLVLFAVTTAVAAAATEIHVFLVMRFFEGLGAAGAIVLSRSIAADRYTGRELGSFMGVMGAIQGIAPITAPMLGALIADAAGGDPDNFPTEWEEIIRLGSAIKKLGNADGISFDVEVWPDDWLWQTLILEQGGSLMDKDGKHCGFNNDFGLNAMRLCRRIVTEGGMTMRDYEQSRQQFVAGKIGIIASSPNAARAFTDLVGSKFKLGCQIYPRMNKEHGRLPTGGNGGMILTKDPIKQRAAWEYLKFACGPEGQKIAVLGSGYMPTNKLAEKPEYLGDFYKKNPLWYTPIKQIPFAMGWQGYTGNNGFRIWTKQRDIIGLVMRGSITPEEGVRQIVSATESLF